MADQSGPTNPVGPDPIEDRLRELARDTEPLVVLAGAAAARGHGERRRARRRTGAVSLVAALALAVGCWQFLPGLRTGADHTLPAASTPASPPPAPLTTTLEAELLPPEALPLYPKWKWETVPAAVEGKYPQTCPITPEPGLVLASAERTYAENDYGLAAHYRLYALTGEGTAQEAAARVAVQAKAKCGPVVAGPDSIASAGPGGDRSLGSVSVWIAWRGVYLAVFDLRATGDGDMGKAGFSGTGDEPAKCIARSLSRLAPDAVDSPVPTGPVGKGSAVTGDTVPPAGAYRPDVGGTGTGTRIDSFPDSTTLTPHC